MGSARPVAAPPPRSVREPAATVAPRSNLPWILAGTAFVVFVVIFAAQRAGQGSSAPAGGVAQAGGSGAVDISSMSPAERARRLFDRTMRLESEGKQDSARFFASMAVGVYESLGPLDLDMRYDYGRMAELGGDLDLALAQADTILQQSPDHLLGLILARAVAAARGQTDRQSSLDRQLLAAETIELARALPEYGLHRTDIDAALAAARNRR